MTATPQPDSVDKTLNDLHSKVLGGHASNDSCIAQAKSELLALLIGEADDHHNGFGAVVTLEAIQRLFGGQS